MNGTAEDWGIVESAQQLGESGGRAWTQAELLVAAEQAVLRNTGWPIGVVIQREGLRPIVSEDGIEVRVLAEELRTEQKPPRGPEWRDYWRSRRDGSFYVARVFEEDYVEPDYTSSEGHPEKALWFDMRIWRIAELLLHSASLYRSLKIEPDEPYQLVVTHSGLAGREFYTSTPRRHVWRGRFCHAEQASWAREVTQDYVSGNLRDLVAEISSQLFVLFDFAEISRDVIDQVIDDFEGRRR